MNQNLIHPNHIAIIPDGNRRWAIDHKLPTIEGHRRGYENVVRIMEYLRKLEISTVTFWAFSVDNWQRSKDEVKHLMRIFELFIDNCHNIWSCNSFMG